MLTTLVRNGALDSDPYGIGEVSDYHQPKSRRNQSLGSPQLMELWLWLSRQGMTSVNGIGQFLSNPRPVPFHSFAHAVDVLHAVSGDLGQWIEGSVKISGGWLHISNSDMDHPSEKTPENFSGEFFFKWYIMMTSHHYRLVNFPDNQYPFRRLMGTWDNQDAK